MTITRATVLTSPVPIVLALVLAAGCAPPGDESTDAGDEVSQSVDPSTEDTESTETGGDANTAVSVELPGLPIGGSEVLFEEPSTQCASVSVTGFDLQDGQSIEITGVEVPGQFSVSSEPCGSGPACLGGAQLTAESASCEVAVTWNGEEAGAEASVVATSASATCADESQCADLVAGVEAAGLQTVSLVTFPPEEETYGTDTTDTTDTPGS